ncbi:MAG: DNA polymerase I [Proteobacteria bacterium]|nr:DNA polymerase I [Pseudomonadota bacterium]
MKKLLIFDASNYMFRAFFASPPMNNSAGFPTNALHFYTSMILSVIRRISPDAIALAHEQRGTKFRSELYPEYKAQREAPPEALQLQFPWFRKITDALGIRAYEACGFEADDVIATLTRQARQNDWHVIIASSDKDLMQLVERVDDVDTVVMLDAMAKAGSKNYHAVTIDNVLERFQVAPDRVADVLALAGDTVDNIPGCKGIGEKTAGKLIAEYGCLENLIQNLDQIKKPAQHANLVAFAPSAELSKKLTTLVYNVPVSLQFDGMNPDPQKVTEIFSALELHRLLTEVLGPDARPNPAVPRIQVPREPAAASDDSAGDCQADEKNPVQGSLPFGNQAAPAEPVIPVAASPSPVGPVEQVRPLISTDVCQNAEELKSFLHSNREKRLALAPLWLNSAIADRQLLGIALASDTSAIYVPIRHQRTLFGDAPGIREYSDIILDCLLDPCCPKAVYGLKPLMQYIFANGKDCPVDAFFDTEIAAYLAHPDRTALTLATCTAEYLGHPLTISPDNWLGTGKKAVLPSSFSAAEAASIAGTWAQLILQLAEKLPGELRAHKLEAPYRELDLPLARILARMEFYGIELDLPSIRDLSKSFDAEIARLDAEIHTYSDAPFNINSPKDLSKFLFEDLKLVPATKKNRTHGLSTDQETLESLDHPVAGLILEYRTIGKLRSTYCSALAELADPHTHRIHGQFNACVTATTRLSSSDPNLQNIPGRTELGRQIKRTFVAHEGYTFISADYSQIELRLMAAFSKEPTLCQAYMNGEDVHARTAASLFEIPIENVTKDQRRLAKTINFGLLYGMGVQKLARETGYSRSEAKVFLEKFHAQFPTLSNFFTNQVQQARQNGEIRTLMGHRRPMSELYSARPMIKAFGERVALNAPIQGSASDIVKRAMIDLDKALSDAGLHARLLIQVHDELLLECPDDEVETASRLLISSMENAAAIGVPLKVELKIGKNWADMNSPFS